MTALFREAHNSWSDRNYYGREGRVKRILSIAILVLCLAGCISLYMQDWQASIAKPSQENGPIAEEAPKAEPATVVACRQRGMGLLRRYAPSSYGLMKTYYELPKKYLINGNVQNLGSLTDAFFVFANFENDFDVVRHLGVVVHESNHSLVDLLGFNLAVTAKRDFSIGSGEYWGYYLGETKRCLVRATATFPAGEMAASASAALQDTARFKPYVLCSAQGGSTLTQGMGAYGLLDEFHAYYWTARTDLELLSFLKEQKEPTCESVHHFCDAADDWYHAYLEFKSFILYYILFARSHNAAVYDGILSRARCSDSVLRQGRDACRDRGWPAVQL